MKAHHLILILIVCTLSQTVLGQIEDLEWSAPYFISNGGAPKLGIDPNNGHLHIIYTESGLQYVHLEFRDETFIEHETGSVPGGQLEQDLWYGGGAIAVDQNGYPHILYRTSLRHIDGDYLFNYRYIKQTHSGWSPSLSIKNDVIRGFNVDMAIDNSNRVHISWAEKIDELTDGFYYRIENHEIVKKQENFNYSRWDNGHGLAISPDGNDVHIVFGRPYTGNRPLSYYYSANAGNTFVLEDNIESTGDLHVRCGHPDIYLDGSGKLHVCYGSGANDGQHVNAKIQYVQYQNTNKTKHTTIVTGGTEEGDLYAEEDTWYVSDIAADETGKNIAVIYQERDKVGVYYNPYTKSYDNYTNANKRNTGGALYVIMSRDYGNTWSEPTKLTDFCHMYDGRTMPAIESYQGVFYVIYEAVDKVYVRAFPNDTDPDPIADAGGPYSGSEGETILLDASQSTDVAINAGIAEFAWDLDADNIYDITTDQEQYSYEFTDNYSGPVILRVTDNNNQVDYDTTEATILNIPPTIEIGNDTTITEGTQISHPCIMSDPGSDLLNCVWRINGSTIQGNTLNYTFNDNGQFTIIAFAQDDDGGSDSDTLYVTVENVAPVADAGGPYTAGIKVPVEFSAYGTTDPGINDDLVFKWDLNNDWKYDATGVTTSKTYIVTGIHVINLKVTDKDGASDSTTTYVTVTNEKPQISGLMNQTIQENGIFDPIILDDYVSDPDQNDTTLTWTVSGQTELIVTLENRILTVTLPEAEWSGKETLKLVVTDAGGLKDSVYVQFRVNAVNDPPQWISQIPDTSFNEDDTLTISLSTLKQKVFDIDNSIDQLEFSIINNVYLFWKIDTLKQQLKIYPQQNWNGKETLQFKVSDPLMAYDLDTTQFMIIPQPDPPDTFSLIQPLYIEAFDWPDTINFKWRPATDADGISSIIYIWTLEQNGITLYDSSVVKTELTFITDEIFDYNLYRWYVTAFDQDLNQIQSSNIGFIAIIDSTTNMDNIKTIPKEFALLQNYPNPFNPETHITYHLPKETHVELTIYNQMGQIVNVLQSGVQQPGIHTITFNSKNKNGQPLSSGVYLYKLQAENHIEIKKMILLQ